MTFQQQQQNNHKKKSTALNSELPFPCSDQKEADVPADLS